MVKDSSSPHHQSPSQNIQVALGGPKLKGDELVVVTVEAEEGITVIEVADEVPTRSRPFIASTS